jgi:hypothetical protein
MPATYTYTVTREQQVTVTANSPTDAARIAEAAFANGQTPEGGVFDGPPGVYGNTTSRVRTVAVTATEWA